MRNLRERGTVTKMQKKYPPKKNIQNGTKFTRIIYCTSRGSQPGFELLGGRSLGWLDAPRKGAPSGIKKPLHTQTRGQYTPGAGVGLGEQAVGVLQRLEVGLAIEHGQRHRQDVGAEEVPVQDAVLQRYVLGWGGGCIQL